MASSRSSPEETLGDDELHSEKIIGMQWSKGASHWDSTISFIKVSLKLRVVL